MTTAIKLRWKRVGRELHSTDGRFELYCASNYRTYWGSSALWRVNGPDGWKTTAGSRRRAKELAEKQANG